MKRPKLNKIPMPENIFSPGQLLITMSPGQWDYLLEVDEVNGNEAFVGAYKKVEDDE